MRRSLIVLLACLYLSSLAAADTQTQLNVTNSPPVLIKNIPDQLVIMNTPKINAFDLDDYFEDFNGDPIIFTHTGLENVTITVNSENQVSFYPDENYSGTQMLQFEAADAVTSAVSNTFFVTVGLDNEPPQWSNPKKSVISIYQNYYVTFTTDWTDNVGLREFIFSINQGSGWQNRTLTLFSGLSNRSAFKEQISAPAGTEVSWTFYATDVYDNTNLVEIQSFTVKEFDASGIEDYDGEDYEGEASEGDFGDGEYGDYGSDSSSGTESNMEYFKEGVLAENLEIDIRNIKVSIKQGENMTRVVQIINTGNTNIRLNTTLKNMERFAELGDIEFEIAPGENHELLIEFTIPKETMPDQYFGFLVLDYGKKIYIPIIIDVREFKAELIINVNLTKDSKAISAGESATALLTIKNMRDVTSSESQLYYAIKNFQGGIIISEQENLILNSLFEEERSLTVPENTPDGEYIFYARIASEDSVDLDSETLFIGTRFKILAILKLALYPALILLLLLILFLLYLVYKRNKKKKRLLELYLLLNELRALVKDGKTKEAMDIYKRIKVSYGQGLSKGFSDNEEKLKEELNKFSSVLEKTEKIAKENSNPKPEDKAEDSSTEKIESIETPKKEEEQKPEIKKPTDNKNPKTPAKTPVAKTPSNPNPKNNIETKPVKKEEAK